MGSSSTIIKLSESESAGELVSDSEITIISVTVIDFWPGGGSISLGLGSNVLVTTPLGNLTGVWRITRIDDDIFLSSLLPPLLLLTRCIFFRAF